MISLRYCPIPAAFYSSRRKKLAAQLPAGSLVIIHSNDIYPTNQDGTFAHHQNANFFYLTGIEQEESILLMQVGENGVHEACLLLRETNDKIAIWEGARLSQTEGQELSGIEDVRWTTQYQSLLAQWVPAAKSIACEGAAQQRKYSPVETRNARMSAALLSSYPEASMQSIYEILTEMRFVKSPAEIEQLRRACKTTGEGFIELLAQIKIGMGEWEIEGHLSSNYTRRRSRKFSFTPIIASGADSCVLHYNSNHKNVEEGSIILLDLGAEYGGYAGDMTRTIPANGKYSERQAAVYNACLAVHKYAKTIMRPGVLKNDYEQQIRGFMGQQLLGLGLISQAEIDENPSNPPAVLRYFMHGTSHSLGLDVHDVCPSNPRFAAMQVWTIEPGIYIKEEGIGVRIETDVVIHEDHVEDLLDFVPIEVAEIEAAMRQR